MKKYRVYGIMTASKFLGEVEAETLKEAIEKGWESKEFHGSSCYQCSAEIDLGDI